MVNILITERRLQNSFLFVLEESVLLRITIRIMAVCKVSL